MGAQQKRHAGKLPDIVDFSAINRCDRCAIRCVLLRFCLHRRAFPPCKDHNETPQGACDTAMGTIVERPRKTRTTAYMAKIVLKSEGKVAIRESKTFERRAAAVAWI